MTTLITLGTIELRGVGEEHMKSFSVQVGLGEEVARQVLIKKTAPNSTWPLHPLLHVSPQAFNVLGVDGSSDRVYKAFGVVYCVADVAQITKLSVRTALIPDNHGPWSDVLLDEWYKRASVSLLRLTQGAHQGHNEMFCREALNPPEQPNLSQNMASVLLPFDNEGLVDLDYYPRVTSAILI